MGFKYTDWYTNALCVLFRLESVTWAPFKSNAEKIKKISIFFSATAGKCNLPPHNINIIHSVHCPCFHLYKPTYAHNQTKLCINVNFHTHNYIINSGIWIVTKHLLTLYWRYFRHYFIYISAILYILHKLSPSLCSSVHPHVTSLSKCS
jgi:hypothetical protein